MLNNSKSSWENDFFEPQNSQKKWSSKMSKKTVIIWPKILIMNDIYEPVEVKIYTNKKAFSVTSVYLSVQRPTDKWTKEIGNGS